MGRAACTTRMIVAVVIVATISLGCRATTWERADARTLRTVSADRILVVVEDRAYLFEDATVADDSLRGRPTRTWRVDRSKPILAANEGEPEELVRRNHWRRESILTTEIVVPLADVRYASRGAEEDSTLVILLLVVSGIVGGYVLLLRASSG